MLKLVKQQKNNNAHTVTRLSQRLTWFSLLTSLMVLTHTIRLCLVIFGSKTQDMGSIGYIFNIIPIKSKMLQCCAVIFIYLSVGKYKLLVLYFDLP